MQRNDNIKDYSRVEFLIFIEPGILRSEFFNYCTCFGLCALGALIYTITI